MIISFLPFDSSTAMNPSIKKSHFKKSFPIKSPSSKRNPSKPSYCYQTRLHLHGGYKPQKISTYAENYMNAHILYPSKSQFLKKMATLENAEKSLNPTPRFIHSCKGGRVPQGSEKISCTLLFLEIKGWSIPSFPANILKKTTSPFLPPERASELYSPSFLLPPPVAELSSTSTKKLPFRTYNNITSEYGILPSPWILSNIGSDIFLHKIDCIGSAVITSICNKRIYSFPMLSNNFRGSLCKMRKMSSVPFISRGYFKRDRNRKLSICCDLNVNLISKKGEIRLLVSPFCIRVGCESRKMGRVYRESEFFSSYQAKSLGDKIYENFGEDLRTESFSKVVEGIMFRGFSVGESAKEGESPIETEFVRKVSFRACKAEIDKEDGFKKGDRVIPFSSLFGVEVTDKRIDKGEINRVEEQFEGVIGWNKGRDFVINEGELSSSFHSMFSSLEYNILQWIEVEEKCSLWA